MTWKAGIIAGGIILILLAGSNFVNYKISYKAGYSAAVATLTQDSTVVTTDTVWAKADTVIKYEWLIVNEAVIDTVNDVVTYSTHIDTVIIKETTVAMNYEHYYEAYTKKDTVAIINQDISFTEGIFKTLMKIDIRPVEKIINITETIFRTVEVPVSADPPFYNTWLAGFISGVISFLLLVIFI